MIIKLKPLLFSLLISLGIGGLSAFFTRNSMIIYEDLQKPALAPPGVVFPIVWTILYFLMGISAYLIYIEYSPGRRQALLLYSIQLLLNFAWSILFFNLGMPLLAFFDLVLLFVFIVMMIISFYKISKPAALLQIPYLLWVGFAGYLNLALILLNK